MVLLKRYFSLFALVLISASCHSDIQIDLRRESQSPTKDIEIVPELSDDDFSIKPTNLNDSINFEITNIQDSEYLIVYNAGITAPENCDSGTTYSTRDFSINSLSPDTTYSYRICLKKGTNSSEGKTGSIKTLLGLVDPAPKYTNGTNWNDYIRNDGSNRLDATDTICTKANFISAGPNLNFCFHTGITKFINITTLASNCDDVSIRDTLGAFEWECNFSAGATYLFITDLKENKNLSDIISTTNFKENRVILSINKLDIASSSLASWWSNPIINMKGKSDTLLDTPGAIYYIDEDFDSSTKFQVTADKISFTALNDAELTTASNFVFEINGTDFHWIEGNFTGATDAGIHLKESFKSILRNIKSYRNENGLFIVGTTVGSLINNSNFSFNNSVGISKNGVFGDGGNHSNTYYNLKLTNNSQDGIELVTYGNFYSRIISVANVMGIHNTSSAYNHYSFMTLFNNSSYAIYNALQPDNYYNQILSLNSSHIWIYHTEATLSQMAIDTTRFSGPNVAILDFFNIAGSSTEDRNHLGVSLDTTFDPNNYLGLGYETTSNTNSTVIKSTDLTTPSDGVDFYKVWAREEGTGFPDNLKRGACTTDCYRWDTMPPKTENQLLNKSNNFTNINESFIADSTCPNAVNGNKAISNTTGAVHYVFLVNAFEIMTDSIGNNNGICESNEACIYAPNVGAYQGHGDYKGNGTCLFVDGTISNVIMYSYPKNGKE